MSWGGAGQRSAYGLHKLNQHPAGAKVVQEPPRSGSQTTRAEVLDGNPDAERIKQFIQRVNNLQGQSVSSTRPDPKLNVHTAHLLVFMFPTTNRIVGGGDTLDAQLTTWKVYFFLFFYLLYQFKSAVGFPGVFPATKFVIDPYKFPLLFFFQIQ